TSGRDLGEVLEGDHRPKSPASKKVRTFLMVESRCRAPLSPRRRGRVNGGRSFTTKAQRTHLKEGSGNLTLCVFLCVPCAFVVNPPTLKAVANGYHPDSVPITKGESMNFLILGDGPDELAWAHTLAEHPEHRLAVACPGFKSWPELPAVGDLDEAL